MPQDEDVETLVEFTAYWPDLQISEVITELKTVNINYYLYLKSADFPYISDLPGPIMVWANYFKNFSHSFSLSRTPTNAVSFRFCEKLFQTFFLVRLLASDSFIFVVLAKLYLTFIRCFYIVRKFGLTGIFFVFFFNTLRLPSNCLLDYKLFDEKSVVLIYVLL